MTRHQGHPPDATMLAVMDVLADGYSQAMSIAGIASCMCFKFVVKPRSSYYNRVQRCVYRLARATQTRPALLQVRALGGKCNPCAVSLTAAGRRWREDGR